MLIDDILISCELLRDEAEYSKSMPLLTSILKSAVRFNLDDNVTRAVVNLVATRPTNLQACLDFARRPHPVLWIEFNVKPRTDLLVTLGIAPTGDHPSKVGVLLQDHPDFPGNLLCGRALVGWRHVGTDIGETAYAELQWDFRPDWQDWRTAAERQYHREKVATVGSIAYLQKDNQRELDAYTALLARFDVRPAWPHRVWLSSYAAQQIAMRVGDFVGRAQSDATSEALVILSMLLSFNTTRAFDYEDVSYDALNKARRKRNKPPLLNHQNVSFHLSKARRRSYAAKGLTVQQGTVLQKVPGYLRSRYSKKRGSRQLFWVTPFQRGDAIFGIGPSISQMRNVKL